MHEQQTISREDPMFDHVESIDFSATFCFTGEFAFGDRKACEQATAQLGATVKPRPVKTGKCYVVVGTLSNPQWRSKSSGSKIDGAIASRAAGCKTFIIYEDDWAEALLDCQKARGIQPAPRFAPPRPVKNVYFLMPPQDLPTLRLAIENAGAKVRARFSPNVDCLVVPDGVSLTEEGLYCFPNVGPDTVGGLLDAVSDGRAVGEETFRECFI
ncbi:hypothetical protein HMPREF0178_00065 [Bilophila sp. 4_1_30]|uniref:hypothetical protein n=1 Tax=Bilophila sp. 4_1_30 TaxID=693988 RepID=UPI000223812F|nr:hypothetical protein [Bilophila sp. 4_1_30]EGW45834.1 hypothetical protein HMPREF0178_00065 [Bilophila sp. 4_1_30]